MCKGDPCGTTLTDYSDYQKQCHYQLLHCLYQFYLRVSNGLNGKTFCGNLFLRKLIFADFWKNRKDCKHQNLEKLSDTVVLYL